MYQSIDKIQRALADSVFAYAGDRKKAAGRALGTFLEIIAWYLIKTWRLEQFTAIERSLPEYANKDITHNVEFTMHGGEEVARKRYCESDIPMSSRAFGDSIFEGAAIKNAVIIDKDKTIKNACVIADGGDDFFTAYTDTRKSECFVRRLSRHPFAMFECKRVGVEEGAKKGPQTIEKAKQGSYVARAVSSLQRIRNSDGSLGGIIQRRDGTYLTGGYYAMLRDVIDSDDADTLRDFILTVGIVSNHGNWFTSDNPNKELKVLAQSYDWLIFLTDEGIARFVTDLLLEPKSAFAPIKSAFLSSYGAAKKTNVFTKVRMSCESDKALCEYFDSNIKKIEPWFNVISPKGRRLSDLKDDLTLLSRKRWREILS